jgi:hypothetical protein
MEVHAAAGVSRSPDSDAEAFGSPSDKGRRPDIPPDVDIAIRGGLTCLRLATTMLTCLSSAANHDFKIDTSSVGAAEIACRLIAEAVDQLVPALTGTRAGVP